jgi:hypothetical protein
VSDTTATRLFGQIKALADIDWQQADAFAEPGRLIVRILETGQHALLAGVNEHGKPLLLIDQQRITLGHRRFDEIEPTGHVWEPAS